jgi:UDP-N-acetyl-D-mannosaminuronic acid dehydrogenase
MCKPETLEGQVDTFDEFVSTGDVIVIMVGHTHIKENMDKLKGKIVLDTRNICNLAGCHKL